MLPFTYCITHLDTGKIYYGVRWAKGCHPSDLWSIYFTSSSKIKEIIQVEGIDAFKAEVRKTFKTAEEAKRWESRVNKRIVGRPNVINKCAWPGISEAQQTKRHATRLVVGKDGLTGYQRAGRLQKEQRSVIDEMTGLSKADLRKMKLNQTLDKNGSRQKMSKFRSEGCSSGRLVAPNKGRLYDLVICPHCQKAGRGGAMKRYHFDACKSVTVW
jgi:hypothetical protein